MDELIEVDDLPSPPARPADAHKGTFGTVIVVGGNSTMIGAAALCAGAALRCGAGLVKIAAPRDVVPFALSIEPCATGICLDLRADPATCLDLLAEADPQHRAILAVGPGLGRSDAAGELVDLLVDGPRPIVLDADGLNLLARAESRIPQRRPEVDADRPLVITPHPGEYARLAERLGIDGNPTDPAQRPAAAAALAGACGAVVVLKGKGSVVSDGRRYRVNTTGNPALATAGSGDVLTGAIAALMAQGMSAWDAAVLGAHLHGLAADLWADRYGQVGLTARVLIDQLPEAFARHAG